MNKITIDAKEINHCQFENLILSVWDFSVKKLNGIYFNEFWIFSPQSGIKPIKGWINGTINTKNIPSVKITAGFWTINVT